ncbi:hypothetical protein [Methylophaga sp. OBS3]|uniref:hypothetical protein n=1 Tax=Methylophaga sp. OBS3 TaxID=2991934 RepID=UPI002253A60D|nr:hypothetical protein [Methylophaga sp. OBS3]MCX4189625.1 hypothetical protein [Methylophaga sp. OBS3]
MMKKISLPIFLMTSVSALADGSAVDKVYQPYVQPLERELEWRLTDADGEQTQRLGYGQSVNDRLFIEGYLIGEDEGNNELRLEAYELEALWQLTEQGEYNYDWGLITEFEWQRDSDDWEVATGLITSREWGRWVATSNLWLKYEWQEDGNKEFETALALQGRYRLASWFEPAVEFYAGENTRALGPVALGDIRLQPGQKLHWELGALTGLNSKTADITWRAALELEF